MRFFFAGVGFGIEWDETRNLCGGIISVGLTGSASWFMPHVCFCRARSHGWRKYEGGWWKRISEPRPRALSLWALEQGWYHSGAWH